MASGRIPGITLDKEDMRLTTGKGDPAQGDRQVHIRLHRGVPVCTLMLCGGIAFTFIFPDMYERYAPSLLDMYELYAPSLPEVSRPEAGAPLPLQLVAEPESGGLYTLFCLAIMIPVLARRVTYNPNLIKDVPEESPLDRHKAHLRYHYWIKRTTLLHTNCSCCGNATTMATACRGCSDSFDSPHLACDDCVVWLCC